MRIEKGEILLPNHVRTHIGIGNRLGNGQTLLVSLIVADGECVNKRISQRKEYIHMNVKRKPNYTLGLKEGEQLI